MKSDAQVRAWADMPRGQRNMSAACVTTTGYQGSHWTRREASGRAHLANHRSRFERDDHLPARQDRDAALPHKVHLLGHFALVHQPVTLATHLHAMATF